MRGLLITALLVLASLLRMAPAYAGSSYYLDVSNSYFLNPSDACMSLSFDSVSRQGETYSVTGQTEIGPISNQGSYSTCALRLYASSGNYINVQGEVGGVVAKITTNVCEAGGTDSLSWPLGRQYTDGRPYQDFGFSYPLKSCVAGCEGVLDPNAESDTFAEDDPADPAAEIAYANLTYNLNGNGCNSSDNPTAPDIPPGESPPDPCEANPNAEGCNGGTDPGDGGTDPGDGGTDPGDGGTDPGDGGTDPGDGGGGDGGTDPGDGGGDGGEGAVTGENCDQAMTCTGDAIECAQLRMQKALRCDGPDLDFPGQKDDIADFLDNPQYEAEEDEEIRLGDMFTEGTRFLPSSCPQAENVSLTLMGGRSFSFSYEPLCQFASDLSFLIVAAAAVFYALYVGRAVGGE